MNSSNAFALALVAVIIAIGGFFYPHAPAPLAGADGDSNFTNLVASGDITAGDDLFVTGDTNIGVFEQGGSVLSTTTTSTSFGTLTEAQMLAASVIVFTPNINSATTTLPAASTFTTLLNTAGDTRSWVLINGTSTASRWVGIAAGSGIDLDSNTLNNAQIATGGSALLTCSTITAATTIRCRLDVLAVAD